MSHGAETIESSGHPLEIPGESACYLRAALRSRLPRSVQS
jgi:hypothetical protein